MTLSIAERVQLGSAFLDEHFTGWWERIDLNTLNISSCTTCVLGQLWCTSAPDERGQIIAQATEIFTRYMDLDAATNLAQYNNPFGHIVDAYRQLRRDGVKDLGFAWYGGEGYYAGLTEAEALTEEWTRVVIQRRLDAHPDVILGCSDLSRLASEQYAAVA